MSDASKTRAGKWLLLAGTAALTLPAAPAAALAQSRDVDDPPRPAAIVVAPRQVGADARVPLTPPVAVAPVGAQQEPRSDVSIPADIVVTGSRIRGAKPVGSSVIDVTSEDIATSSRISTAQILQQVPQIYNLGVSENARAQTGGASNSSFSSGLNLRGLGPYATLPLVNGHRVVVQGVSGETTFNPSSIATNALARVEVVADGASAIYGSDAVAGVVNLILRRDIEGLEAGGRIGFGRDYRQYQASLAAGHRWSSGQISLAYDMSWRSELQGIDRGYFRSDLRNRGGNDYRTSQCDPGTLHIGGTSYALPAAGLTSANAASLVPGTVNLCEGVSDQSLIPRQVQHDIAMTFDQGLGDSISIYGDGFAAWRRTFFQRKRGRGTFEIPATNAFYVPVPGADPAQPQTIDLSFANMLGNETVKARSVAIQGTIGTRIDLWRDIALDLFVTHGRDRDAAYETDIDAGVIAAALADSDPARALDPYGGGRTSAATIDSIRGSAGMDVRAVHHLTQAAGKIDGTLIALPGGRLRFALGGEIVRTTVSQGYSLGPTPLPPITYSKVGRTVESLYGELSIPLVGPDNAVPGIRNLRVSAAGRFDHYSDVGNTTNPKVGVSWEPLSGLTLRGSYGTSFRAPALNPNTPPLLFVQTYSDPASPTGLTTGFTLTGGPSNLRPETAATYTLGVDLAPAAVKGLNLSLTYFSIDYRNQIASYLSDVTILQKPDQFAAIVSRNPDPDFINAFLPNGVIGTPPPPPYTLLVDGRSLNLGRTVARGLDFDFGYRWAMAGGMAGVGLNGTRYFTYKIAYTPGAPLINTLNTIFNPAKLRMRGHIDWSSGGWSAILYANYLGSYRNDRAAVVQRVRSNMTFDLDIGYTLPGGEGLPRDVRLGINVENLFDRKPPFVNLVQDAYFSSAGFDPTASSPLGRVVSLSLGTKF